MEEFLGFLDVKLDWEINELRVLLHLQSAFLQEF